MPKLGEGLKKSLFKDKEASAEKTPEGAAMMNMIMGLKQQLNKTLSGIKRKKSTIMDTDPLSKSNTKNSENTLAGKLKRLEPMLSNQE